MNRRCLCIVVAALCFLFVGSTQGEPQPVPRVGFVTVSPAFRDAFIDALRRLGYQDGQNIIIDWRPNPNAELRDVEDLVNLKPNLLFLAGPTNLAYARKLTTTIPIVAIDLESDPVVSGIAFSLAHPGGNVTGIFLDLPELAGKEIQFLREVLPALKRLAVMWQEPIAGPQLRAAGAAAQAAGIAMIPLGVCSSGVCSSGEVEQALANAMTGKQQALLVLTGPAMFPLRVQIANLARQ